MAVRLNNHITGDSAVNQIKAQLIPESWIINDQTNDYGLDLNVQVCKDNHTTECFFFVQSKGTKDVSHEGEISYAMSVERLKDYKELPLPVLLVFYSKTENVFWGIWANGIYETLTEEQKKQDTYSIRFTRNNIIDEAYLESIGSHIQKEYTNRIDIRIENTQPDLVRLHHQLFKLLEKTFPNQFSFLNKLACRAMTVAYTKENNGITICMQDRNEDIMTLTGQFEEAFLWYPETNIEESPFVIKMCVAAIGLLYVDKKSQYPYNIYSTEILDALFPLEPEHCWLDWVYNFPVDKLTILEHVIELCVQPRYKGIALYVQLALRFRGEPEMGALRERLFRTMIDQEATPQEKGHLCYNLANQVAFKNLKEAVLLYIQASKHFPAYLNVYYWWKELASLLFHTMHYYFSQKFYEKAVALTNDNDKKKEIVLLIADTCIYQKDVGKAQRWLLKYFDICAIEGKTIPAKVHLLSKAYQILSDEVEYGHAVMADGESWYNEGINRQNNGDFSGALNAFVISWAFEVKNINPIKAALAMSINVGDAVLLAFILETIRSTFPNGEINFVVNEIVGWHLPKKSKEGLLSILNGEMP